MTSKIEIQGCITLKEINIRVLGEVRWGISPQGERPKIYS